MYKYSQNDLKKIVVFMSSVLKALNWSWLAFKIFGKTIAINFFSV